MLKQIFKKIIVIILTLEAKLVLAKYKPKIVAVAGSVGKTSTRDAIYTVLNSKLSVWKSDKSYNTDIGVPLSILGLKTAWSNPFLWLVNILKGLELVIFKTPYPEYLVLELGADRPGDIKKIVSWLSPDISVLTRFGEIPVHIEFFKGRDELIEEDGEIVKALKQKGLLVLNHDDKDALAFKSRTNAKTLSFGFDTAASLVASNLQIVYEGENIPSGVACKVDFEGNSLPLRLGGAIGKAQIYASLPALLIGNYLGINLIDGVEALIKHETPPGRLKIIKGLKNAIIIDDSYNSSPVATEEALAAVFQVTVSGKRILVLGDMMELGRNSEEEHKRIGRLAGRMCDILVTVGIRARGIAEGALISGLTEKNIFQFEEAGDAGKFVEGIIGAGDIVLVKGSQSTRMERIVEEIMSEPDKKEKLLMRQDEEWKKK